MFINCVFYLARPAKALRFRNQSKIATTKFCCTYKFQKLKSLVFYFFRITFAGQTPKVRNIVQLFFFMAWQTILILCGWSGWSWFLRGSLLIDDINLHGSFKRDCKFWTNCCDVRLKIAPYSKWGNFLSKRIHQKKYDWNDTKHQLEISNLVKFCQNMRWKQIQIISIKFTILFEWSDITIKIFIIMVIILLRVNFINISIKLWKPI